MRFFRGVSLFCFLSFSIQLNASASELTQIVIELERGRKITTHDIYCSDGKPGELRIKRGNSVFTPLTKLRRNFVKKFKKTGKKRFKSKANLYKKLNKSGLTACANKKDGPSDPIGSEPIGTVEPPPSSPPPTGGETTYFDSTGEVTSLGKSVFQLPAGISANLIRGMTAFEISCSCHATNERIKPTYPELKEAMAGNPMFLRVPEDVSEQSAYDIFAWLNRFRTPATE